MARKADIEVTQDFMGTAIRVGDHIARTINGEMILSQITRIRLKTSSRWDHTLKKWCLTRRTRYANSEMFRTRAEHHR